MLYADIQKLIASYAPDMLQPFADKFERFPNENTAIKIANELKKKSQFYQPYDVNISEQLEKASDEIMKRCFKT